MQPMKEQLERLDKKASTKTLGASAKVKPGTTVQARRWRPKEEFAWSVSEKRWYKRPLEKKSTGNAGDDEDEDDQDKIVFNRQLAAEEAEEENLSEMTKLKRPARLAQ